MATLGNPKNTIEILQKYHFNFQKKFGQNFLIDTRVLEEIIEAAQITKEDFVLEIGPGIGTMTQYLAEAAGKVLAVEIDRMLIPILQETLKEEIGDGNHRVEKANDSYYMLKKSQGPFVIVECGFLSNPEEEKLLNSEDYQKKMAKALAEGIEKFLYND